MTTITIPFQLNFEEMGEHLLNKDVVSQINSIFAEYGAVLLRGFPLKTAEDFADVATQFITTPTDYTGGTIVRQPIKGLVYNSSEFPPAVTFPIHNEMGYADKPPERILFFCLEKAEVGGQTPICDCRRVLQRLPNQLVDAIRTHGVRYIRRLPKENGDYLGGWSQAFKTEDTRIAEERCKAMGCDCTWDEGDIMVITNTVEGIRRHPHTGEELWVNQITSYHSSRHEHALRITPQEFFGDLVASVKSDKIKASPILKFIARASSPLLLKLGSKMLPILLFFQKWYAPGNIYWNCTLGNGTPFTRKDIEAIWDAVITETIVFNWQQGDILFLDNFRFGHGRKPFRGKRQVLVSFGS
ncbi:MULTISPECIES: TauD/TfdA family dioxygenase [unclassified Nostoc]|uniref:TauD/TfdA family dioxygenase n=1 Tax=unclassified Nostoc TaxID=2593658 RepID=UPI001DF9756F|nr:TauD/TfdA family dioxygenase [Nostoc sp. JL23]MBN3875379.1 TauD/TfdA family dioxygenase [Nostoc sp. JL23]